MKIDKLDIEILITYLKTIRNWGAPLTHDNLELIVDRVVEICGEQIQDEIDEAVYAAEQKFTDKVWQDAYDEGYHEGTWELETLRDNAYDEGFEKGIEEGTRLTKAELREFCSA